MEPLVIGLADPAGPGWAEARSIAELETLVREGRTVAVTPAALATAALATAAGRAARDAEEAGAGNAEGAGEAGGADDAEAAEIAVACVCAWLGARVFRTARPEQVRMALRMTESLAGRRPPALTRRGLA
ncbi:hypothetical protein Misp01_26230 [Microtetraspora sp. NBRC 13810]|uniref:hypothetical protein n=1 Tax=Microtetraspora sp. NBRC 13810 TaxID=3030990 RepID=UPI0024A372DF|nr:hypothetical protein [Microtetraspora sp. NBRC 13810]GLW07493.1 hypothetical protein Misp01_26230 [Microtetraspora sp. NBRC 13810]